MNVDWLSISELVYLISYVIPVIMLFVVPSNRKPSSATAWLLLAFFVPYVGLFIYLYFGSPKLPANRRAKQQTMTDNIREISKAVRALPEYSGYLNPPILPRYQPLVDLITNLGGMPPIQGNGVRVLPEYPKVFEVIAQAIGAAQKYVHVEYYALNWDEETEAVFLALLEASQRGVTVRVLFDHIGSRKYPGFKTLQARLTAAEIENHIILPLRLIGRNATRLDLRNHRKIVVIDGNTGFTGSQNLIRRNYFRKDKIYYDELVAQVHGPIAHQLNAAFVTDWYSETGVELYKENAAEMFPFAPDFRGESLCQVLPSGPGFENENNLKLFTALLYTARRKAVITNPYFVPDDALMTAITSAAQRGVEVILFNSEVSDQFFVSHSQRSYYEQLLKAGVKLYWYRAPILLHSKFFTIDDDIAVIGSSNLDMRSFQLNLEVSLVCYDGAVVEKLREIEATYLSKAMPVTLEEWEKRPLFRRLFENIARLTSSLQ
jgi:cardiolipin synthase